MVVLGSLDLVNERVLALDFFIEGATKLVIGLGDRVLLSGQLGVDLFLLFECTSELVHLGGETCLGGCGVRDCLLLLFVFHLQLGILVLKVSARLFV